MTLTMKQIEEAPVIWKPGTMHCQDFVIDGKTSVRGIPVDEYLKEHPGCVLMESKAFFDNVHRLENECYIKEWTEIDKERFWDMLEILPPEKWKHLSVDCEVFRMIEYDCGNITNHFVRIGKRYFEASRRTSQDYKEMIQEIKTQFEL